MAKYEVTRARKVWITEHYHIEADSEDEAREKFSDATPEEEKEWLIGGPYEKQYDSYTEVYPL